MIDNVTVAVTGDAQLVERFRRAPGKLRDMVRRDVTAEASKVEALAKQKVSGDVLNVRSGKLRSAINTQDTETQNDIASSTGVNRRTVPYAAIHEYGGRTRPHVILPKKGNLLVFNIGGRKIFTTKVNHPGSTIPERSYLRSSLTERAPHIRQRLAASAVEALRP